MLEQSAAQDSNSAAAHYALALAYWNEKRYDEAERSLRLSMMLDAQYAEPHLALAFLPFARRPRLWHETQDNRVLEEWKAAMEERGRRSRRPKARCDC